MAIRERYWETKPGRRPEDPSVEQLTKAGADYLMAHQSPPPKDYVRADSSGLRMTEVLDGSNRPIREFSLAPGATKASTWMGPYMSQPHLQIRINKRAGAPDSIDNAVFEARWAEDQRLIATGTYQLPEL